MKIYPKLLAAFITLVVTAACGTTSSNIPPDGPSAYLQNRLVERGETRFFYFFEFANDSVLEPGGINKAQVKTRAIFKTNSPYDKQYRIDTGFTVVGVRVVYTPAFSRNFFARMNDLYYHIFVRDLRYTYDQMSWLIENMPDARLDDFSGLDGLDFEALEGHTYVINSRIEDGRAKVWIEDNDGTIVSDVVTGFGDAATEMRGTAGAIMETGRDQILNPWAENLPDPYKGWGLLTDLPPPPN